MTPLQKTIFNILHTKTAWLSAAVTQCNKIGHFFLLQRHTSTAKNNDVQTDVY